MWGNLISACVLLSVGTDRLLLPLFSLLSPRTSLPGNPTDPASLLLQLPLFPAKLIPPNEWGGGGGVAGWWLGGRDLIASQQAEKISHPLFPLSTPHPPLLCLLSAEAWCCPLEIPGSTEVGQPPLFIFILSSLKYIFCCSYFVHPHNRPSGFRCTNIQKYISPERGGKKKKLFVYVPAFVSSSFFFIKHSSGEVYLWDSSSNLSIPLCFSLFGLFLWVSMR